MFNKTYITGDSHGNWFELNRIIKKYCKVNILHVGDVGLGFPAYEQHHGIWIPVNKPNNDPKFFPERFYFIAGNHDNKEACRKYPNYLGDFGFNKELNIFYVSGGFSIDKNDRTIGVDWWADEELSINQFNECIDLYEAIKPDYVISHECPSLIRNELWKNKGGAYGNHSRTAQALQAMYEIYQPNLWYFGHHHKVWSKQIEKTKFTCVAINQTIKLKN